MTPKTPDFGDGYQDGRVNITSRGLVRLANLNKIFGFNGQEWDKSVGEYLDLDDLVESKRAVDLDINSSDFKIIDITYKIGNGFLPVDPYIQENFTQDGLIAALTMCYAAHDYFTAEFKKLLKQGKVPYAIINPDFNAEGAFVIERHGSGKKVICSFSYTVRLVYLQDSEKEVSVEVHEKKPDRKRDDPFDDFVNSKDFTAFDEDGLDGSGYGDPGYPRLPTPH